MTARRAFGTTAAILTIGLPLATLSAVAGFVLADLVTNWRYRRRPNLPHPSAFGALEDTQEFDWDTDWLMRGER